MGTEKLWCGGVDCATGAGNANERSHIHVGEGYSEELM